MPNIQTFSLPASADGVTLSVLLVQPTGIPACGILQLVHGMCEHKERYLPFMQFMADNGYICVLHDHRGHGASVRQHADLGYFHAGGWQAMIDDVLVVHRHVRKAFPTLPVHLFGHSMGSLVVRALVKRHFLRLATLTVCGSPSLHPATALAQGLAALCERVGGGHYRPHWLKRLAFGAFDRPFRKDCLHNAWVCSDSAVVEVYNADPLCNFTFTANGFRNLFAMMRYVYSSRNWAYVDANLPVFFISGGNDVCRRSDTAFAKAVALMKNAGYRCVDSRLFEGMRHEILNEVQHHMVWNAVLQKLQEAHST